MSLLVDLFLCKLKITIIYKSGYLWARQKMFTSLVRHAFHMFSESIDLHEKWLLKEVLVNYVLCYWLLQLNEITFYLKMRKRNTRVVSLDGYFHFRNVTDAGLKV